MKGQRSQAVPAGPLLRPVPLVALVVLVVNDHVLKETWPGWVTGKLSDVAGMVFLPMLLMAAFELVRAGLGYPWQASERVVTVAVLATVLMFGLAKASPTIGHAYGDVMGWLQWPVVRRWRRVHVAHDLSDLLTLPAAGLAWWDARRAIRPRTTV